MSALPAPHRSLRDLPLLQQGKGAGRWGSESRPLGSLPMTTRKRKVGWRRNGLLRSSMHELASGWWENALHILGTGPSSTSPPLLPSAAFLSDLGLQWPFENHPWAWWRKMLQICRPLDSGPWRSPLSSPHGCGISFPDLLSRDFFLQATPAWTLQQAEPVPSLWFLWQEEWKVLLGGRIFCVPSAPSWRGGSSRLCRVTQGWKPGPAAEAGFSAHRPLQRSRVPPGIMSCRRMRWRAWGYLQKQDEPDLEERPALPHRNLHPGECGSG